MRTTIKLGVFIVLLYLVSGCTENQFPEKQPIQQESTAEFEYSQDIDMKKLDELAQTMAQVVDNKDS